MSSPNTPFSERLGLTPEDIPISVRKAAPAELRHFLLAQAQRAGLEPAQIRSIICDVLLVPRHPDLYSHPENVTKENIAHLDAAPWYEIYDLLEVLHRKISSLSPSEAETFSAVMNSYFHKRGIGWALADGKVEARTEPPATAALIVAVDTLVSAGLPTSAQEFREARRDLSRRPEPDLTGAVQHALAGLEAAVRATTGDSHATLGALLQRHPSVLPPPLDSAIQKVWGYASETARHLREGASVPFPEAELVVGLAAVVAAYVTHSVRGRTA
jgi:hypothetical protein